MKWTVQAWTHGDSLPLESLSNPVRTLEEIKGEFSRLESTRKEVIKAK